MRGRYKVDSSKAIELLDTTLKYSLISSSTWRLYKQAHIARRLMTDNTLTAQIHSKNLSAKKMELMKSVLAAAIALYTSSVLGEDLNVYIYCSISPLLRIAISHGERLNVG